jgi:hypothetical protein
MPASVTLLHKTPFVLDPRPLPGCASPRAGLLSVRRTARSLHLPGLIAANIAIKQRERGLSEAQHIESILLSLVAGGESDSDLAVLALSPASAEALGLGCGACNWPIFQDSKRVLVTPHRSRPRFET